MDGAGSKAAAAGWRDADLPLCSSRVVTFQMERARAARVVRCPTCGSSSACPLCPLAFYTQCGSCGAGLRYDLDVHASWPSFYALTLLPFPHVEGAGSSAAILALDGCAQRAAIGAPGRAPSTLLDLEELDEVLPGFSVGHQMSAARPAGASARAAGKWRGPTDFALLLAQSERGERLRKAAGLPAGLPPLLLLRAPCAPACSQAVACLSGAYVGRTHAPSVHRREQPVLQGKLLVASELLWLDRFLVLTRPAGRALPPRTPAADEHGRAGPWPGPSAWPGPAKLHVFAAEGAAVPLHVLPLTAGVRILDERPSNFLFAVLTRVEPAARPPADAPSAGGAPGSQRAGAASAPGGFSVCEIAAPDQPSKQRWMQAIREAVREGAAHRPAHAAADTTSADAAARPKAQQPACGPGRPSRLQLSLTLRHAGCEAAYRGPRFATAEQLAAAFASRFGDDLRAALARVGPSDAPGAHRMHELGRSVRVGELVFLQAARAQAGADGGTDAATGGAPVEREVAFGLGELRSGMVVIARSDARGEPAR